MRTLNRNAAIVGVGTTRVGRIPNKSALELAMDAMCAAVDDAGLTWNEVDGLYSAQSRVDPFSTSSPVLAEHVGIKTTFGMSMPTGGMQFTSAIYQSAAMIAAGMAEVVVLVAADNLLSGYGRSRTIDHFAETGSPEFETPFGTHIPSLYAMIAQRHMYDYGTTSEQLAAYAVQMRRNAAQHPGAHLRDPITVDDVLSSKPIASPLHLLDCAPISDGGVALILASPDRARELPQTPIWILGAGECRIHQHVTQSPSMSRFVARDCSAQAFRMADMTLNDIDVAMLYDAFTITPILSLEALGFCAEGEGGRFVAEGNISPDAAIPVNPMGGVLSYGNPGRPAGLVLVAEAVAQLRATSLGFQVPGAQTALVQTNAGILSGEMTLILGR